MKVSIPAIALALAWYGGCAARADWQYTRWGMSPQEVIVASGNITKENSDLRPDSNGYVTKLVAPYQTGKYSFEARFGFDANNKLSSVTLVLSDKSADMEMEMDADPNMPMDTDRGICHELDMAVNGTYGRPNYQGASHLYAIKRWQDLKKQNNVDYHKLYGVGCYVQYVSSSLLEPTEVLPQR